MGQEKGYRGVRGIKQCKCVVVGKGMEKAMFSVRLNTCYVAPCRNQIVTKGTPRCGRFIYWVQYL